MGITNLEFCQKIWRKGKLIGPFQETETKIISIIYDFFQATGCSGMNNS